MSAVDSRQGPGTLELGTLTGAGCQMSNVRLVPARDEQDGTPTLCEPDPAPEVTTTWSLQGTAIQDWEDSAGFVEFCRQSDGDTVSFTWHPNTSLTPDVTYSGSCQVRAVEIGGAVGEQNTADFEFPVVGDLSRSEV